MLREGNVCGDLGRKRKVAEEEGSLGYGRGPGKERGRDDGDWGGDRDKEREVSGGG